MATRADADARAAGVGVAAGPTREALGGGRGRTTERYYDRLRGSIDAWLQKHSGTRYSVYRQILFLVPDVFTLVVRLAQDGRVSLANRLKLWGLTVYILSPVDINLDFILPLGPVDDLALSLIVLDSVLGSTPLEVVEDNWPGEKGAIDKLQALTRALRSLKTFGRRNGRR